LSDPALVRGFAETVGTEDRLNMLFVLTYADTHAVGPGVWNEWKATLLEDLYAKARRHLAGEAGAPSSADRRSRVLERVPAIRSAPSPPAIRTWATS
jgi:[protein-PII] uridylyltransferase